MKTALLGMGAALALTLASAGAQAMPVARDLGAAPTVDHVIYGDGCGPRRVRTPRGFCRPVGGPRFYGPPPRRFYGPPRPRFYYGPPRPPVYRY